MIPLIIAELEQAHERLHLSWRELCAELPYSTLMRWKARLRKGQPPVQSPGSKKLQPLSPEFFQQLRQLAHGRARTHGTIELHRQFSQSISRRQVQLLVRQDRHDQLQSMKRIHWLRPNLAWSADATEYRGWKIIPLQDLASRYRLNAIISPSEDGAQIAALLEAAFKEHGPPLFFKRDNGSPFNCREVDQVLARHWVLPLNNPPAYPRYNGAMEKSIRDLKEALDRRAFQWQAPPAQLSLQLEASIHQLNHQSRRCLRGRTPCECFHDRAQRLTLGVKARKLIFRLLHLRFLQTIGAMESGNHHQMAAAWRLTVEHWLRCQNWIAITTHNQPKPQTNVSTVLPKKWSHN